MTKSHDTNANLSLQTGTSPLQFPLFVCVYGGLCRRVRSKVVPELVEHLGTCQRVLDLQAVVVRVVLVLPPRLRGGKRLRLQNLGFPML